MTLLGKPPRRTEVGVRELHDHLSRYVRDAQAGTEVIVTMRGKQVARLTALDDSQSAALADLEARGIIKQPLKPRSAEWPAPIKARGSVSELVSELRD